VITGRRRLIEWRPSEAARAAHDTLTIEGFVLDGSDATFEEMGYAGLITVASGTGGHVRLVVRNNTLKNVLSSSRGLYIQGDVFGVAASNVFDRVGIALGIYGNDYDSWASYRQEYGTGNSFYFEDNTIRFSSDFSGQGHAGFITSGQGGRVVVRYNSWDYTNVSDPGEFWDVHGLQGANPWGGTTGCENYSSMMAEYYGNSIVNQNNAYRWMQHRGGWLLMFYNSLSGSTSPISWAMQYYCNACQAKGSFNQKADNSYYWRNLANGAESVFKVDNQPTSEPGVGCTGSDPIVLDVDVMNFSPAFDGSRGVGCGPLEARPPTCTPGAGYWATNQSCTDLRGMIGARPPSPIDGTLYRCASSGTWNAYYAPFTYPYPWSSPAAPQNVILR